jgi:short-subunit dehydrogenase
MRWLDDMEVLPDLWVNNAGVFDFREVCDLTPERLDLYVNLHCRSLTQLCRAVAPRMAARGSGEILNMSSMSCWMPMPGIAMYAATKAYIRAFSRALRLELKDSGVSVTVACPGGIATDLFGLPRNLQRLGVKLGALQTPQRFVIGAIRATLRHRKQHINGLIINRLAIVAVGLLPDFLRIQVKRLLLDRWKQQGKR